MMNDPITEVPFAVFRQILMIIGSFIFIFTLLGWFLSPKWFLILGLIGLGMVLAGIFGVCSLLLLLPRLPWNKKYYPERVKFRDESKANGEPQ